jgi:hypothetical protein
MPPGVARRSGPIVGRNKLKPHCADTGVAFAVRWFGAIAPLIMPYGLVTRRSVMQNLPPSSNSSDVPAWMWSMPW